MNKIVNPTQVRVDISGYNNEVIIGSNCRMAPENVIYIGTLDCPICNCKVHIGNNVLSHGFMIRLGEDNTVVTIGDNCMFSSGIQIWASDTHTILNQDNKVCNIGNHINIGNHVWVGMNSTILKNTTIPDNSIIGFGAIVSGDKFTEKGSIIVGNPGKVVKIGMNWDEMRPKQWINSHI